MVDGQIDVIQYKMAIRNKTSRLTTVPNVYHKVSEHDCLNMSFVRTGIDKLKWMGKAHNVSAPNNELQGREEC